MARETQSSHRESPSRGAHAATPRQGDPPRVIVTSPRSLRIAVLACVLALCGWLASSAAGAGRRVDAFGLVVAGIIWVSFLRLLAERLEFGTDAITFRAAVFEYTFPRRSVDRVSLQRAGRTARLDLGDGTPFHAQVFDWNRPRHEAASRARLAEFLREIPRRPFEVAELHHPDVGRWRPAAATERDIDRVRPTHAFAPLRPSETFAIVVTVLAALSLAVFGS